MQMQRRTRNRVNAGRSTILGLLVMRILTSVISLHDVLIILINYHSPRRILVHASSLYQTMSDRGLVGRLLKHGLHALWVCLPQKSSRDPRFCSARMRVSALFLGSHDIGYDNRTPSDNYCKAERCRRFLTVKRRVSLWLHGSGEVPIFSVSTRQQLAVLGYRCLYLSWSFPLFRIRMCC